MTDVKNETATDESVVPIDLTLVDSVEELVEEGAEGFFENISMPEWLQPFADLLGSQPWIRGLAVLMVFVAFAKIIEWGLIPLIRRLSARIFPQEYHLVVHHSRSPLVWSIVLLGVLVATMASDFGEKTTDFLVSIVLSLLFFLWMLFGMRVSRPLLKAASQKAKPNAIVRPQTLPLFTNLAAIAIFVFGIYFIFKTWRVDMTAWLASAGIAGIAIGFAAKDTLANLFSGVFIMADSPYRIGDYVVLDEGVGIRGKITHIGIRSTRLQTRDDVQVTIPNSIMGNSKVINESGGPHEKFRIRVAVGVAYGSDIDQVRTVLMSVAEASNDVCDDPEPRVRFRAFGRSSLDFELLCWVHNPELRGFVLDALNTTVYKRFREESIEIPYAKQDLYIKEMPSSPRQISIPDNE